MPSNSSRVLDQRLVMYRISKSRSYSVGSEVAKVKRKAEFQDSEVVTVNTNAPSEVIDKQKALEHHSEEEMVSKKGFARLDVATIKNMGWSSKVVDDKIGDTTTEKDNTIVNVDDFYKLSKVEFRRLQEQVRDVSLNLRNKFRTSAYQMPPCDQPGCKEETCTQLGFRKKPD